MVVLLSRLVCALPHGAALAVGRFFGRLWYYLVPIRLRVARQNLRRMLPERTRAEHERILKAALENLCMTGIEALRLPLLTPELAGALLRSTTRAPLLDGVKSGKGVIAVLAHIGSFELLAAGHSMLGIPTNPIVREIGWGPAQRFSKLVRQRTGLGLIAPRKSKEIIKGLLAKGEVVAMLVDQHMPKHRALVCEFFGHLASTSPAPARFALESGARMIVATVRRDRKDPRFHDVHIESFELETPYIDIAANVRHNTERINRVLERFIKDNPEEWLWLHKRFKVQDAPEGWEIPPHLAHLVTR
jgi:Kdo2-lipid IVA lauroyltransferase/acyltransferase